MGELKFRITYQHSETGRITQRFMELGEPIPHLGIDWQVVGKDQFIGLKDRDGKEIFEGDIVKVGYFALNDTVKFGSTPWKNLPVDIKEDDITTETARHEIIFNYNFLATLERVIKENPDCIGIEVIRNIYENADLLETP
uniref:Putative YopX protein n=1 Tax=viral metagenome TaxID=1070528 RepID=A0A6H1ZWI6_9ZZZZ